MKKTFKVLMAVMVMLSSTVLVSCGDDHDDVIDNHGNNKPTSIIKVYAASISEVYFDLFDISMVIYSKGKSATVSLQKSDGVKEDHKYVKDGVETPFSAYNFVCDKIDEKHIGIDSVKVNVVPKKNIEDIINGKDPNQRIVYAAGSKLFDAVYSAVGKYTSLSFGISTSASVGFPEGLLAEKNNTKGYENKASVLSMSLTQD